MVDERRQAQRIETAMVVQLETIDGKRGPRLGVTRDASSNGLLLGCSRGYEIGEELWLVMQRSGDPQPTRARCRVVRSESNPAPSSTLWTFLIALQFVGEVPGLEDMIEEAVQSHKH